MLALELQKYGVTVNAIAPVAKTRMTEDLPMFQGAGEELDPKHIAPIVIYLASDLSQEYTGRIFGVQGKKLFIYKMTVSDGMETPGSIWTPQEIAKNIKTILGE